MGLFSTIGSALGSVFGGPIGGAVGGLAGGLLERNDAQNSAKSQMAYQTQMSNTSYQRAVKDMRAAGLNPALAYSQGGASTPSGAGYSTTDVFSSAQQASLANREQKNRNAQADASVMLANEQQQTEEDKQKLLQAQTLGEIVRASQTSNSAKEIEARTRIIKARLPQVEAEGRFYKSGEGQSLNAWRLLMKNLFGGPLSGLINIAK